MSSPSSPRKNARFSRLVAPAIALFLVAVGTVVWLLQSGSAVRGGSDRDKAAVSRASEEGLHAASALPAEGKPKSEKPDPALAFQQAASRSNRSNSDEPGAKLADLYAIWRRDPVAVEPTLLGRAEVAEYLESNAIDGSDETFCTTRICRTRIIVTSREGVDELGRVGGPRDREIALGDLEPTENGTVVVGYWPINGYSLSDLRSERGL